MSRMVLVAPPWYRLMHWHSSEMPLGLCSLAGYLKGRGHEVWVLNEDLVRGGGLGEYDQKWMLEAYDEYQGLLADRGATIWQEAVEAIERLTPDVVGMTVQVGSFGSTRRVAQLFKERNPEIPVVVGGPLASIDPTGTLGVEAFDYCIQGEGEEALAELVEVLARGEEVSGVANLAFRTSQGVQVNARRSYISNLDGLPFPDRESLVGLERYPADGLGAIFTARGCPFQCTYCAASGVWERRVRYRSPGNVLEEMRMVHARYGVRRFGFKDDTFTIRKERTAELCGLIREHLPGITWSCKTRADCVDEGLVKKMAKAGCTHVEIGLESGCPEVLEQVRKGETLEQIQAAGKVFRRAGVPTLVNIIVGFPGERPDQMRQSLEAAVSMKPGRILASLLSPYPGTEIHRQLVASGELDPKTGWETYFHASGSSERLKEDPEFAETVQEVFDAVERYNRSRWRRLRSFGYLAARHPGVALARLRRHFRPGSPDKETPCP